MPKSQYGVLVQCNDSWFVLLLEMKRGKNERRVWKTQEAFDQHSLSHILWSSVEGEDHFAILALFIGQSLYMRLVSYIFHWTGRGYSQTISMCFMVLHKGHSSFSVYYWNLLPQKKEIWHKPELLPNHHEKMQ